MKLAARIGQTSDSRKDDQCTSTFNLCPYTIKQMKRMVTGDKTEPEDETNNKPTLPPWYENSEPQLRRTTPNPISQAIYIINPENMDGQRPSPPSKIPPPQIPKLTTTTTIRPRQTSTTIKSHIRKQFLGGGIREPEDDESGFDNPSITYNKNIIPPSSDVKVIKIQEQATSSEEEDAEEHLKKIPPKFKSTMKTQVTKLGNKKVHPTENLKEKSDEISSEEDEVKTKLPHKIQKTKIGLPRPKYSIKHKYRNRPLSTEQGKDPTQSKKKQVIAQSSEESSKESNKRTNSEESDETVKPSAPTKSSEEEGSEEKPKEVQIAEKLRLNSKQPEKYKLKNRPKNKLEFKQVQDSDESVENQQDEDERNKMKEIEKSSEERNKFADSSEEKVNGSDNKVSNSQEEQDSIEQSQHPKPSMHPIKYSYYDKNGEQIITQKPKPTSGGILGSLFGGNKKKSHHVHASANHKKPDTQNQSSELTVKSSEENEEEKTSSTQKDEDESSEEIKPTPLLPSSTSPPTTLGTTTTVEPTKKSKKDINKPVIIDPSKSKPLKTQSSKFPNLPRFPHPTGTRTESPTTKPPSTTTPTSRKDNDEEYEDTNSTEVEDEEKSIEADSSSSKEHLDKTAESKESSEEDPNHVKNIFTKGSISSLGESTDDEKRPEIPPPPPPPIANWKPINTNETKTNFKNITKSPNAQATLSTPTQQSTGGESDEKAGSEEAENDSEEGVVVDGVLSKELIDDEDNSSEEDKKIKVPNKKHEDDEADNKEPLIVPAEDDIPELGDDVITLYPKPEFPSQTSTFGRLPAPALAPVSNFNQVNEIKVPMVPPTIKDGNNDPTKTASTVIDAAEPNTKAVPNAASPAAASPGGGLPGGGLPGGGSPPGGRGPGRLPNPGGGNRMPGGNNRPGTGNSNNGAGGEESSEEEVGKSSEEDKTSEEEEEEDDDGKNERSNLGSKKNQLKSSKLLNQTTTPSPTVGSSDVYPPLPPIYKWKSQPTLMTRLMKPKTAKPTLRLPKPSTTKDTFYSKPLSPMLVQYLRETYGNSYVVPPRKLTTTTTQKPKVIKKKKEPENSFKKTFENTQSIGNQASDVIQLDEFEHVDNEFNRRLGIPGGSKTSKTTKRRRRRPVPPVFGKIITLQG